MTATDSHTALVRSFIDAFLADDIVGMEQLLSEHCVDAHPDPIQAPGRDGILFKLASFNARHRHAQVEVTRLVAAAAHVIAEWTAVFGDGLHTRWRGRFRVVNKRVRGFEVGRM